MRNYRFRARPPVEGARIVDQQLRLGFDFQKALVLVEHRRRAAVDLLYHQACPNEYAALAKATQVVEAQIAIVRANRSTGGDILPPDEDMQAEKREIDKAAKAALDASREQEKVARQALYDARKKATPGLKDRLKACDEAAYAENKRAYNAVGSDVEVTAVMALVNVIVAFRGWNTPFYPAVWAGETESAALGWGTRLEIQKFVDQAKQAALKEGSLPKIQHFDGGGRIAVQLQGASGVAGKNGLAVSDAFKGTDTRFRLDMVDAGTWHGMQHTRAGSPRSAFIGNGGALVKNGPRKGQPRQPLPQPDPNSKRSRDFAECVEVSGVDAIARLRVGSNGRAPVWGVWPVLLHRGDLPTGAIKWAQMHARRVGARLKWSLVVTVDDEQPSARTEGLMLAVNLGWRNLPDTNGEIRVAYAIGSDGREEEVRVSIAYTRGVEHVASLTAIRKKLFNEAVKVLDDWIEEGERPEALVKAAKWRDRWLSPKKLVRFIIGTWKQNRFTGDERVWEIFQKWMKKDRHLWFWESDEREKLLRMRREQYRVIAARWATEYARILVTDMDLRDFAEKVPEAADKTDKVQRVTQRLAAPSELRGAIMNAASTRGCVVKEVKRVSKGVGPTITCNTCGCVARFDARAEIKHTCYECKAEWDQDANHCRNLLASGKAARNHAHLLAPTGNEGADGGSVKKKGRWQERRSKKHAQNGVAAAVLK